MKKKLITSLIIGTFLISGLSFIGCGSSDNSIDQTNTASDINSKKDSTTSENTKTDNVQDKQESSKDSNIENSSSSEIDKKANENAETSKPKEDSNQTNDSSISKEKSNKEEVNSSKKTDSTSNDENKTNKNSNSNPDEKKLKYEYEEADKKLNELWHQIVSYGADYPDLIKSQEKWIKYKDSKDLATKTKLTQERITTLENWFAYQRRIQGEKGYQFAQTHKCPSLDWN
ncbi:hypothetical protein ACSXCW_02615 [Clostridium perfringens]